RHKVEGGSGIAAVAVVAGEGALIALASALLIILSVLVAIIAAMKAAGSGHTLGQVMDELRSSLLDRDNPAERAAGTFVWRVIAYLAFKSQVEKDPFNTISYAVMDNHNYRDTSCMVNVDSIELLFRADDPKLPLY